MIGSQTNLPTFRADFGAQFNDCGILVTSATRNDVALPRQYLGVAKGCPWPLDGVEPLSDDEKGVIAEIESWFLPYSYRVATIPDLRLALRYIDLCGKRAIQTRVLLCITRTPQPSVQQPFHNELKKRSVFLGFDYCDVALDYSALVDDLSQNVPPPLDLYTGLLNEQFLFPNAELADAYVAERWKFAKTHPQVLEDGAALTVVGVRGVDTADIVSLVG